MTPERAKIMTALTQAAANFAAEDFGAQFYDEDEDQTPRALYVQRDIAGEWKASFRPAEDMDAEMTRWATGTEAGRIYNELMDPEGIATQIETAWDPEWDEE